ncbi:uncharacterized protein LOC109490419 isoform X2 [Ailuropoda melanoleuca]|uniref:uncharacterized protein LOC109490419 isoform X2 n=1 Tax=Ailuropoda melanoleuca TaxID=9646 RepID=UPI001494C860|nr:uncharacterized protein LOC109490419 isoform X2 [Ailuropoda melanoleuca]
MDGTQGTAQRECHTWGRYSVLPRPADLYVWFFLVSALSLTCGEHTEGRPSMDWMILAALVRVIVSTHLLVQMQISSRNTLTDTSRSNVLPAIWASLSPVKWTHKSHQHESLQLKDKCSMLAFIRGHGKKRDKGAWMIALLRGEGAETSDLECALIYYLKTLWSTLQMSASRPEDGCPLPPVGSWMGQVRKVCL